MPRLLILHASVGTGHRSAARAIEAACEQLSISAVVRDIFDYALPIVRTAYVEPYLALTARAPELYGAYYKVSDQETALQKELRRLIDRITVDKIEALLAETQPRAIICTHYLPLGVLSVLKKRGRLPQPLLCVVTDYVAHAQWVYDHVDGYFVASEQVRPQLMSRGVPEKLIFPTGIPINPAIAEPKEPAAIRAALDLPADGAVVTLFGGGLDPDEVYWMVADLLARPIHGALEVVAGRNELLPTTLRPLRSSDTLRLRVHGVIEGVDDLIAASDLVVSKPGGLIVAETLARGTPLLVTAPIPGHEEHNADYVAGTGAGLTIYLPANVPNAVERLLAAPERLAAMRAAAPQAGFPTAAFDIARHATRFSEEPH